MQGQFRRKGSGCDKQIYGASAAWFPTRIRNGRINESIRACCFDVKRERCESLFCSLEAILAPCSFDWVARACGPAASSAKLTAAMVISFGRSRASSDSRSINTEVSSRPCGCSAKRRGFLSGEVVAVGAKALEIDGGCARERGQNRGLRNEGLSP